MKHVVAFVVVGVLVCPFGVRAEEQDVQVLFQQGVELYQAGQLAEALATFETANGIRSVPTILYNIAMCQRDLGHIPESVNAFRQYLFEEDPARTTDEDRAEIQRMLLEMRPGHGDIELRVNEDGATLLVDGQDVGISPMVRPVAVAPGEHRVSARLEGRIPVDRASTVRGGETVTVELSLEPVAEPPPVEPEPVPVPEPVLAEAEPQPVDTPDVAVSPEPQESRPLGWWFWTSLALSGAATVGMVVTGGLTMSYSNQFHNSSNLDLDAFDSGSSLAVATNALLGVACGFAAIAVISLIVHYARGDRSSDENADDLAVLWFNPSTGSAW